MPKKKLPFSFPPNMMLLGIYGIWSKADKKIIHITLDPEESELEYDMEGYTEDTHVLVFLNAAYDISNLEPLSP